MSVPDGAEFWLIEQAQPGAVRLPAGHLRPGSGSVPGHRGRERYVAADQGGQRLLRLEVRRVGQHLLPQGLDRGPEALPIISEGLAAAVPPGHPLAARDRVGLAEVAAYPIVCLPRGTGVRAVLDQACAARGLAPEIGLEASAPSAVTDLAARGLGVAVLSATMVAIQSDQHPGRLEALAIEDVPIPALLALIWPEAQSPALREFLRHCRQAFATPPAGQLVPS